MRTVDQLPKTTDVNFALKRQVILALVDDPEDSQALHQAALLFTGGMKAALRLAEKVRELREHFCSLADTDIPSLEDDLSKAQRRSDDLEEALANVQAKLDVANRAKKEILDQFEQVMRRRDDVVLMGAFRVKRHPQNPGESLRQSKVDPTFAAYFGEETLERVRDLDSENFPDFGRWRNKPDGEE